jgi:hypothetical protein
LRLIDRGTLYPIDLRNLERLSIEDVARRARVKMNRLDGPHLTTASIFYDWLLTERNNHVESMWQTFAEQEKTPATALRDALLLHALWLSGRGNNRVPELTAMWGRGGGPYRHLHRTIRGMLRRAVQADAVRTDVAPGVLASFALHALEAARGEPTVKGIARLVDLTMETMAPKM